MAAERIAVEVACALPDRQIVLPLEVPAGCTAGEAITELRHMLNQVNQRRTVGINYQG